MGSEMKGLGALVGLKLVCCGGPLLAMAVASGALALVDVAVGALALLAVAAVGLLVVRRRGAACATPSPVGRSPECGSLDRRGGRAAGASATRMREVV